MSRTGLRKVPWRSRAELIEVYEAVYGSPGQTDINWEGRRWACTRLKTWLHLHPQSHPISISLLLSLLSSLLPFAPLASTSSSTFDPHQTRLSLSLSLIRFINSLCDPLQGGQYARPIAAIARELGLPGWLVELRHQATHEGLEGLETLKEGAEEALHYIKQTFFLPILSPPSFSTSFDPQSHTSVIVPLLNTHKVLSKQLLSDMAQSAVKEELKKLRQGVVRAIASGNASLEEVAEWCVGKGGLVPKSRKKRLRMADQNEGDAEGDMDVDVASAITTSNVANTTLPSSLIAIHSALLTYITNSSPSFPRILCMKILEALDSMTSPAEDDSHLDMLAGWAVWVWVELVAAEGADAEDDREVVLGYLVEKCLNNERLRNVLSALCQQHSALQTRYVSLLAIIPNIISPAALTTTSSFEGTLQEMESRLHLARQNLKRKRAWDDNPSALAPLSGVDAVDESLVKASDVNAMVMPGWRKCSRKDWVARPMGWII